MRSHWHGRQETLDELPVCFVIEVALDDLACAGDSEIDGFASYSDDRNDPTRLAGALGIPQIQLEGTIADLTFHVKSKDQAP